MKKMPVGTVVKLKSGSPPMTIIEVVPKTAETYDLGWFDGDGYCTIKNMPGAALQLVAEGEPIDH